MSWKPKLTPAKMRALRLIAESMDPQGYKAKGTVLTSCHPLQLMGLVDRVAYDRFFPTCAGMAALADPAGYKPVEI